MTKKGRRAGPKPPRSPSPRSPPTPLRLVACILATLPFWFNSAARNLLVPLYSAAPVYAYADNLSFYTLIAVASAALFFRRKDLPPVDWRIRWLVIGVSKILTEGLVRWKDGWLVTRADTLSTGVWTSRLVLECISTVTLLLWIGETWYCKERKAFLPRLFLPLAYLVSLLPPVSSFLRAKLPILPECYILQVHGLLLCLVALAAPRTYAPRHPRSHPTPTTFVERLSIHPFARLCLFLSVLAFAHSVGQTSSHCPTSPSTLPPGVLAAQKSVTGWITVGEHTLPSPEGSHSGSDMTFRYLRADHSLLGGLWVGPSRDELQRRAGGRGEVEEAEVVRRAESIYSTFILQELVRLVPAPEDLPRQSPEQGLIIGLGAGLSARALAQHGVNLTLVEIDPVVYAYARDYFGVSDVQAGEVVLEDAVRWVEKQEEGGKMFDYIVHDVFTGGAVPASLFTEPFLSRLAGLLHPSGVLALNFAGTLSSPSSRAILTTIHRVFTSPPHSGSCRAIEDVPHTASGPSRPSSPDAFRNLVLFCSRSWFVPVEFRPPTKGDYLPFPSPGIRHSVFRTFREQEVDLAPFIATGEEPEVRRWVIKGERDARRVEQEQLPEVRMHWAAMRDVLPREVWARW